MKAAGGSKRHSFARESKEAENLKGGRQKQHRADREDKDYVDELRAFRNTDLLFASLTKPHGAIFDADGELIALDVGSRGYKGAHYATYPPDLIKPLIIGGSRPGDTVIDPFGGTGTTAAVALELGREAIIIELGDIDLAKARLAAVTPGMDFDE